MSRARRFAPLLSLLVFGSVSLTPRIAAQAGGQPSAKNGEWPHYAADLKGTRY